MTRLGKAGEHGEFGLLPTSLEFGLCPPFDCWGGLDMRGGLRGRKVNHAFPTFQ